MSAGPIAPARWALLSPWLDELLDLDPADATARAALLAQAAAQDPALADELAAMLARLDTQGGEAFMQTAAPGAGAAGHRTGGPASPAGQRVGAYVVQRLLGQGGMGSVWLAQRADGRYDGQVAIKFLHGGLFGRGDAQRFAREGQILARLDHPHIARLLDAGLTDDDAQPYLVLEFVQGLPIDEHVRAHGLDVRATVGLFMDVLAAVSHAHERLILHRDLKPSNILVTPQGQAKLLDFGIAKLVSDALEPGAATQLTQQAGRAFTLRYAAPEQVDGADASQQATTATDVYALGVLLHVLVTGGLHPTATADTDAPLAYLHALVHTTPRLPSQRVAMQGGAQAGRLTRMLQGDLDNIIGRALKKPPAERYRNAAELADDLRRYLAHQPVAARADSAPYRMAKFVRRNRWGVAAAGGVLLALGVGTGLALESAREATAQRRLADQQRVQAEGLVEFMLGDLRAKLEPVGRLDALAAVGGKVLGYYEAQDPARMDADAVGRRGQALSLLGGLAEQRGQLAESERSYALAVASLAELARREPANPRRLVDYAQSLNGLSTVQQHRGDLARAEAAQREGLALTERARALRPGDPALALAVVDAQVGLAIFFGDTGRPAQGLPLLQAAHTEALRHVQRTPAVWSSIANIRACIADAEYQMGLYEQSILTIQTQLDAVKQAPGGGADRELQNLKALGINRMAGAQLLAGRPDEAARQYREVVEMDLALSAVDPDNLYLLSNLVRHRNYLADALLWAGRPAEAREQTTLAQPSLQRLLATADPPLDWRIRLLGEQLVNQTRLSPPGEPPLRELQAYEARVAALLAAGTAFTDSQQRRVAELRSQLGDVLQRHGQPAEARRLWAAAAALMEVTATRGSDAHVATLAKLRWRLGDAAGAEALVAQLDRTHYRPPDYLAFRRAMQRGVAPPP